MDQPGKIRPVLDDISDEEDAAITKAAMEDPDSWLPTDEELATMRPVWDVPHLVADLQKHGYLGRPPMPPEQRKQRVTLHLDPDVLARLKADGKGWQTRANAALRKALML
jgi:uncharacterized protein (DUF4415 family)